MKLGLVSLICYFEIRKIANLWLSPGKKFDLEYVGLCHQLSNLNLQTPFTPPSSDTYFLMKIAKY